MREKQTEKPRGMSKNFPFPGIKNKSKKVIATWAKNVLAEWILLLQFFEPLSERVTERGQNSALFTLSFIDEK